MVERIGQATGLLRLFGFALQSNVVLQDTVHLDTKRARKLSEELENLRRILRTLIADLRTRWMLPTGSSNKQY